MVKDVSALSFTLTPRNVIFLQFGLLLSPLCPRGTKGLDVDSPDLVGVLSLLT